jgi:hypothetical protein
VITFLSRGDYFPVCVGIGFLSVGSIN